MSKFWEKFRISNNTKALYQVDSMELKLEKDSRFQEIISIIYSSKLSNMGCKCVTWNNPRNTKICVGKWFLKPPHKFFSEKRNFRYFIKISSMARIICTLNWLRTIIKKLYCSEFLIIMRWKFQVPKSRKWSQIPALKRI